MKKSLGPKTLALPTPVWAVGTYGEDGRPNAMTAAWGGICCSKPPCVSVSLRAATLSHGNIMARKAFTISIPSASQADAADYFGIVSGRDADKFAVTGLTPKRSEKVDAPYVAEFPLILECSLKEVVELGLHTLFVGEIVDVLCDEAALVGEAPDIDKVAPIVYATGTRTYHGIGAFLGKGFSIGRGFMDPEKRPDREF